MVRILCFGNLWQGDDGFGIHVCRQLQRVLRQGAAQIVEVGLRALDALPLIEQARHVILVDALHDPQDRPGSVKVLERREIPPTTNACPHSAGVSFLLQTLAVRQTPEPEITLIGAVIGEPRPFTDRLSPTLSAALPEVVDEIRKRLGINQPESRVEDRT